jgi:DNA-binding CsgD family transcriptional regulator
VSASRASSAYNSGKGTLSNAVVRRVFWGYMNNQKTTKLSAGDQELVGLVAVGLTDDEIATQLQIPRHKVSKHITRLLAKLGAQDRVEIVLYAYSDPTLYQRISTAVLRRTTKNPQVHTPSVKQKAS